LEKKKFNVRKWAVLLFLALGAFNVFAQDQEEDQGGPVKGKYMLGTAPQYLLFNALRIDAEFLDKMPLRVSFTGYGGNSNLFRNQRKLDNTGPDKLLGAGLEAAWKIKLQEDLMEQFYFEPGVGYHFINYKFTDHDWQMVVENGTEYYKLMPGDFYENVSRFDIFAIISYRANIFYSERLLLHAWFGGVYRLAKINTNLVKPRNHRNIIYHGYTGAGLKAGIGIYYKFG